ncbi:MAG TPA: hypothetical protein ENN12_03440 [Epsilonproteobacteria bacterium]|mgnify:CR=1 FL=1|nr:hypothetical protein [Campylobacterota bacterium]
MIIAKTVDRARMANNRLNNAYTKGSIVYPRTEYNYDLYKDFDFYPHPPIPQFDVFSTPLKYKKYPLIKDTLPVEMSNHKLSTAATLLGTMEWIDQFYDDNLKPRSSTVRKSIEVRLDKFYDHLEYLDKTFKTETIRTEDGGFDIDMISKDGYVARMKMDIMPFRIPIQPTPQLFRKIKKTNATARKRKRNQDTNSYKDIRERMIETPSIDKALELFQKRSLGLFYLRRKAEHLMRESFLMQQDLKNLENNYHKSDQKICS